MARNDEPHGTPELPPARDPAAILAEWRERERRREALAQQAMPHNKAALFGPLAAAGIARVVVEFDGCGDSGQIEAIDAFDAEGNARALPAICVELRTPDWQGEGIETAALDLRDAVERLAYDLLEETHAGWENNDGACGTFTFDVAAEMIRLEHQSRFTDYDTSEHDW